MLQFDALFVTQSREPGLLQEHAYRSCRFRTAVGCSNRLNASIATIGSRNDRACDSPAFIRNAHFGK
jgi:hypothetical protein